MQEKLNYVQSRGEQAHGKKYEYRELRRLPNGTLQVLLKCPDPSHDAFWQSTSNHYSGKGCATCNRAGKPMLHDLESIKAKFESLSSDRYEYLGIDRSGKTPMLQLKCSVHGEFTQNLYNHLSGKGCRLCNQGQSNKVSDACLQKIADERGIGFRGHYQKYASKNRVLQLTCLKHGDYEQQMTSFIKGAECPGCAAETAGKTRLNSLEDLQKYLPEGVKIVDQDYANNHTLIECEKHGIRLGNRASIFSGVGCLACSAAGSKEASEMYLELLSFGLNIEKESILPNSRLRVDFYFPQKKIAVEYHGLYWHSEEKVGRNYHRDKHKIAEAAGIRIIHIFSDEWQHRKSAVLSLIKNSLGIAAESVFARKLTVSKITMEKASKFFEEHHIQGKTTSSKYLGLIKPCGTLVACLAYSLRDTNRTRSDGTVCEITRFASSVRVVGGFGKLIKAIQNSNSTVKKFVTFSDIRVFSGNLYEKLGFKLSKVLPPDYSYIVDNRRMHKSGFTLEKFAKSETLRYVENMTETQLAELNGLSRVYDCGKVRWELTL